MNDSDEDETNEEQSFRCNTFIQDAQKDHGDETNKEQSSSCNTFRDSLLLFKMLKRTTARKQIKSRAPAAILLFTMFSRATVKMKETQSRAAAAVLFKMP